jgi:NADH-quinone oxidoreductase subunit L
MKNLVLIVILAPLIGALIAGLFGRKIGRTASSSVTILGVALSLAVSCVLFYNINMGIEPVQQFTLYQWIASSIPMQVGVLLDPLSTTMLLVVNFVSLMVHIYTIGYMAEDPGYQRFFSYISLFTFSMLMLVLSNNFMQLFFGWEAVGVCSYLLIGFWYTRESAIFANLKAFLVNRVGDFGFLIGIAALFLFFKTLDYQPVFDQAASWAAQNQTVMISPYWQVSAITFICIGLFIGAMGKSAQVPLHVWLPDSMEGPTPISALIHAATMVTAGVFMVARMSPLFELSETARVFVLCIGVITAFFMGLLGLVQNDIKRVIAYSTLSQLGYMVAALGVSAYAAGVFHLVTHAFFKALLFLGAGSVIIAMHHKQDMREMGNLKKYMPITYITSLIGAIALAGIPPFSGFFSKESILEAIHLSNLPGSGIAYIAVLAGVFITALYTFRLIFMVFHGKERMDHHTQEHLHETPAVVWVPLVLLAIPSMIVGWFVIEKFLFSDQGFWRGALFIQPENNVLHHMAEEFHGSFAAVLHAPTTLPFWLAILGVATAWVCYIKKPEIPRQVVKKISPLYRILERKYGFDELNQWLFARGARNLGNGLWQYSDQACIDGVMVNGSARAVGWFSRIVRQVQTGYLYHYAFAMLLGLLLFITMIVWVKF